VVHLDENDTTKYVIHARIKADGVVEQPDVVGAIFGQTEGLLGSDMDLRELQKSGRIGRIDVEISSSRGKSTGEMRIPSSLDRVDTSILAAALETIDRIGPCIAQVEIKNIEDVRTSKRQLVVERAKTILQEMFEENAMESQEIVESVKKAVRVDNIVSVGGLPAGPSLKESDAIIVVEGRADVLKLLSCGIKNAIAVEGTNIPKFVADLTKRKTVTAYTDGDRGGELIIKELLQVGDINYVAQAPDGKSVEDLTQREVFKTLRNKVPVDQYIDSMNRKTRSRSGGRTVESRRGRYSDAKPDTTEYPVSSKSDERTKKTLLPKRKTLSKKAIVREAPRSWNAKSSIKVDIAAPPRKEVKTVIKTAIPNPYRDSLNKLAGTLTAKLLGENDVEIDIVAVRDIANTLKNANSEVKGVVFDGVITQRLLDIAADKGLDFIAGVKLGNVVKQPTNIKVLILQ